MKKLFIYLLPLLIGISFMSCDNSDNELVEEYNQLLTEEDSLETNSLELLATHEQIVENHNNLMTQIATMEDIDTALLARMRAHEVILSRHEAIFEAHEEMRVAHENLVDDQVIDNLTDEGVKAQLEQMQEDHEKMMEEHENMEQAYIKIKRDHEEVRKMLEERLAREVSTS